MSTLKPGTLCMTVGGSGENAGRIVVVIAYVGPFPRDPRVINGYEIEPANGLPFAAVRNFPAKGTMRILRNTAMRCKADRSNLRPLVDPDGKPLAIPRDRKRPVAKPRAMVAALKSPVVEPV